MGRTDEAIKKARADATALQNHPLGSLRIFERVCSVYHQERENTGGQINRSLTTFGRALGLDEKTITHILARAMHKHERKSRLCRGGKCLAVNGRHRNPTYIRIDGSKTI